MTPTETATHTPKSHQRQKQGPIIVESTLTRPSRWFVLTRYVEKKGIHPVTGDDVCYLKAITKYDVTDQMTAILKNRQRKGR